MTCIDIDSPIWMTAQRALDLGVDMHKLAIDRDDPISSREARLRQL
jgi:hypothetical protein